MKKIQRLLTLFDANDRLINEYQEYATKVGFDSQTKLQTIQGKINQLVNERAEMFRELEENYRKELSKK